MLTDPINLTINAVSVAHPRTSISPTQSVYTAADGTTAVVIKQTSTKERLRHEIRVIQNKISADPLVPATNVKRGLSVYVVVDEPIVGFTDVEIGYIWSALFSYFGSSAMQRVCAGEM
jgi:hypothetical protein